MCHNLTPPPPPSPPPHLHPVLSLQFQDIIHTYESSAILNNGRTEDDLNVLFYQLDIGMREVPPPAPDHGETMNGPGSYRGCDRGGGGGCGPSSMDIVGRGGGDVCNSSNASDDSDDDAPPPPPPPALVSSAPNSAASFASVGSGVSGVSGVSGASGGSGTCLSMPLSSGSFSSSVASSAFAAQLHGSVSALLQPPPPPAMAVAVAAMVVAPPVVMGSVIDFYNGVWNTLMNRAALASKVPVVKAAGGGGQEGGRGQ